MMKLKLMRYELLKKHTELVKQGEFEVARLILEFLIKQRITLGFSDVCNKTESILDRMGFKISYDRRWYMATVFYKVA